MISSSASTHSEVSWGLRSSGASTRGFSMRVHLKVTFSTAGGQAGKDGRGIDKIDRVYHASFNPGLSTLAQGRADPKLGIYSRLKGASMPKYVIERNLPGAGQLSFAELAAVSDKSC